MQTALNNIFIGVLMVMQVMATFMALCRLFNP